MSAPVEVMASGTITVGGITTDVTDCDGKVNVNYWFALTAKTGAAARLDVTAQWSHDNVVWFSQKTEAIATGVATQADYDAQFPIAAVPAKEHLSLPTFGRRYSRVIVHADANTFTTSTVTMTLGA